MIKAAVFDLDHTLFDRYATIRKIITTADSAVLPFKESIDREELVNIFEYCDRNFVHLGWSRMYDEFLSRGILKDGIARENFFTNHIRPIYMLDAVLFPFTVSVLNKLHEMGLKVALITNGPHELQYRKLELLGIESLFDEIIVGGDTPYPKPDVRIFADMANRLNLKPEEMLYIGDNPINDIEPSRKAGYIPVWIRTTGTWVFPDIEKPELQVDTVNSIPEIVNKLNERKS